MGLALNNLKRVDMPLNKETKPELLEQVEFWYTQIIQSSITYRIESICIIHKRRRPYLELYKSHYFIGKVGKVPMV